MKILPGNISKNPPIKKILKLIRKAYGKKAPGPFYRKSNAIDELVRTILSQNTSDTNSLAAFAILKKSFKRWDAVLKTGTAEIAHMIRHAGLANIKAERIKTVLAEIKRREGKLSLVSLRKMDASDALEYLRSLKGVGPKTASCVLLFSFGKPVMPVDTHIYRVTRRLGLVPRDLGIEQAHSYLTNIVPKGLIYSFHLGIIMHGRNTCKAQTPRCGVCLLYDLCKFEDKKCFVPPETAGLAKTR